MIRQITEHSFLYRGFTIIKLPRKAMNPVTRYHIWLDDQSFGKFDAMAEAIKYIDLLKGDFHEPINQATKQIQTKQ